MAPADPVDIVDVDDIEFIAGSAPATESSETSAQAVATTPRRWLIGLAALGVVLPLLFALSRPGASSDETSPPTTSGAPAAGAQPSGSPAADGRTGDRPTSDLALFVGSPSELIRIDLGNGAVTQFERTVGVPIHSTDGWLIFIHPGGESVRAVPLAQVDGDAEILGTNAWTEGAFGPGPEPSQVWYPTEEGAATWRFIRVSEGYEERSQASPDVGFGRIALRPLVTTSSEGGVYAANGEDYVEVFDGNLMAIGHQHVIAQRCRDRGSGGEPGTAEQLQHDIDRAGHGESSCRLHWLTRGTWDEPDRPVPDVTLACGGWLSGDGRWFAYFDTGGVASENLTLRNVRVFDTVTGEHLDLSSAQDLPITGRCDMASTRGRFGEYDTVEPGRTGFDTVEPLNLQIHMVDRRDEPES
ncbi:MAG: hypothetical protein AAF467_19560 [Actinomycetota bacterium]